jgi:hypothetical protein
MPIDIAPAEPAITPPPPPPPPPIHTSNIVGAPVSTILGITAGLEGTLHSLPNGAWPTNAMGWVGLALSIAMATFGALSKG